MSWIFDVKILIFSDIQKPSRIKYLHFVQKNYIELYGWFFLIVGKRPHSIITDKHLALLGKGKKQFKVITYLPGGDSSQTSVGIHGRFRIRLVNEPNVWFIHQYAKKKRYYFFVRVKKKEHFREIFTPLICLIHIRKMLIVPPIMEK